MKETFVKLIDISKLGTSLNWMKFHRGSFFLTQKALQRVIDYKLNASNLNAKK